MTKPIPSQSQIDAARDIVERAQFRLGKCQTRAILSGAQARADKASVEAASIERDEAESAFQAMVDAYTQTDDIATATSAIRAALEPKDIAPRPIDYVAAAPQPTVVAFTHDRVDDYVPPRPFGTFQGGTVQAVLLIRGVWQMQVDGEWFECPPSDRDHLPMAGDFVPHHSNFTIAGDDAESAIDPAGRKNGETADPVLAGAVSRLFAGN